MASILLPLDIVAYILDMADIDTRIKMYRQKRMDRTRLTIPGFQRRLAWEKDIMEMTVYVPLPGGQKQYVYSVNMQTPHQVWEQLVMVVFLPYSSMEILYDRFHVV